MIKLKRKLMVSSLVLALSHNVSTLANDNDIKNLEDTPRNTFFDRMMTTLNPELTLSGPIFVNTESAKTKYARQLMRIILQEADKKAQRYYKAGDYQAYYSFMVLALTVPLQEGLYMQFRHVYDGPTLCNQHSSSGDILFAPNPEKLEQKYTPEELAEKKEKSTTYKHFINALKSGDSPVFVDCENFNYQDGPVSQIVRGYDGSDMGMMQLSIRWHYDEFYAKKDFLSVRKTIRYGLNHLMNGFRPVLANAKNYKCLSDKKWLFGKKTFSYKNLIRGVWAGKYNSGSIKKTCRFSEFNSPYKHHDEGFEKNLEKVLAYDKNRVIGAGSSLGFLVDDQTHEALKQVITNFKKKTNDRDKIDAFIAHD
jgi:hypothetical protein